MAAELADDGRAGRPALTRRLSVDWDHPEVAAGRVPGGGVLYYAMGGGLGHLTRGLAVARHFARRCGAPFTVLTNCRASLPSDCSVLCLSNEPGRNAAELGGLMVRLCDVVRPGLLVVDAFPAGILGELAELLGPDRSMLAPLRATVVRRLQSRWVQRWNLTRVLGSYDQVLVVDEGVSWCSSERPNSVVAPPVTIREPSELRSRQHARRRLGLHDDRPIACLVPDDNPDRLLGEGACLALEQVCPDVRVFAASLRSDPPDPAAGVARLAHFPLMELLPAFDLVLGPAGYNLTYETLAAKTPSILVPRPRLYDDQAGRCLGRPFARSISELAAWLEGWKRDSASLSAALSAPTGGWGGADAVAERLVALLGGQPAPAGTRRGQRDI